MRRAGTVSCRRHESLQEEHAEQPEEEAEERLRGVGGGAPDGGGRAEQHQHARGVEEEVVPDSVVAARHVGLTSLGHWRGASRTGFWPARRRLL